MKNNRFLMHFIFLFLSLQGFATVKIFNEDSLKVKKIKQEYEVALAEGLNTKNAEFCAVPYADKILLVTDQLKDLVNNESVDVNGFPYVDVFLAGTAKGRTERIIPFSNRINGPFHDGPVAFNAAQTQLYLTRVDYINKGRRDFVNKAKLLVFEKKEIVGLIRYHLNIIMNLILLVMRQFHTMVIICFLQVICPEAKAVRIFTYVKEMAQSGKLLKILVQKLIQTRMKSFHI